LGELALSLETAEKVVLTEAIVTGLREGGVVENIALEAEPAEPAIGEVEVNFLGVSPLRADAEAIATISIRIITSGSIEDRPIGL
jgi:hypothetical protein